MKILNFNVGDMHCEGCADRLKTVLERTPGVVAARVSFTEGRAQVRLSPRVDTAEPLVAAIERAGFRVIEPS